MIPFRGLLALFLMVAVPSVFLMVALPPSPTPFPANTSKPVKLAVLVVFDQLRGDYLQRWQPLYRSGFRRLTEEGAWYQNCHYPYGGTVTGPGHASLGSGYLPSQHGIIFNNWYDRQEGASVYCATQPRYQQVPPPAKKVDPTKEKDKGSASPERMLVANLADRFKEVRGDKGKVVSLSLKDRSATLPGGRLADACYWFDSGEGKFVTSTYYRDSVHPWIKDYNDSKRADQWFGKEWTRLYHSLDYTAYSGPDDVPGEVDGAKQGRTFPHPLNGGKPIPGKEYYEALYTSPFGNELLLEVVKRAIDAEKLGQRETADLLLVSFSSNDPVGHAWGPDSQEVLDTTLRTDRLMADFLTFLDQKVGQGNYLLVLSADHGICPLPEVMKARGYPAGRVPSTLLRQNAEDFLQKTFPSGAEKPVKAIEDYENDSFYLNRRWLVANNLSSSSVEAKLAAWAVQQPGILRAYTRTQLQSEIPTNDAIGQRVKRSFHPERSGDIILVLKPYYLMLDRYPTGTTHGAPHSYDTHVPLVVFGPGVRPGPRSTPVVPQDAPLILANGLGLGANALPGAFGKVPPDLYPK